MNTLCPGCSRNVVAVDGSEDRVTCYEGKGDVCIDGKLWCLNCLAKEKCPCVGAKPE